MTAGLPKHLAALLSPRAYPHPVREVRLVETHVSWVLLTGEFAYKIKRPVVYPFVDLRSAERRAFFCCEEVRLNRRFAPELYLEVVEITEANGEARIGGRGRMLERAVKMRQFNRDEELDRLLARGTIEPHELEAFARHLADIHATLPAATPAQAWGRPAAVRALVLENLAQCAQAAKVFGSQSAVESLRTALEALLESAEPWMSARFLNERVRECHGDLHSRNIVRRESRLVAFDCMEFEPAFRWVDVADEVAFLLADLHAQKRPLHAHAFLNGYAAQSGDYDACRFIRLYIAHRAVVRAKVLALQSSRDQHLQFIDSARRALDPPKPVLVLMSGLSGSGKTWLASRIAPQLGALHVRSDVERKRLAGIAERARSSSGLASGIYTEQSSERVYGHLARCATHALAGNYPVVVDATFLRREDRSLFRARALELGVDVWMVRCEASPEVLQERITRRQQTHHDASEANLTVLDWQRCHFDAVSLDEGIRSIHADTTDPDIASKVVQQIGGCTTTTPRTDRRT